MVPYVAYLRVYEPLSAFDDEEASRWASYARAEDEATDTVTTLLDEQQRALTSVLRPTGLAAPSSFDDTAYLLRDGEDVLVCPHDLRLRSWLALAELIDEVGDEQLRLLAPGSLEHVNPDFMSWRSKNPDAVPHIRQQTWQVPPAWFLLVSPEEMQTYAVDGERSSVRYRCPIVQARRRMGAAFSVVRRSFADEPIVDVLSELGSWLEAFHPHSWLELDFAGVAMLLDDVQDDDSCADIAHAVTALSRGDVADATATYERVIERWRRVRMVEHAN